MPSPSAFLAWTQRLRLSAEAVDEITLIRMTLPHRRVRSGAGSVPCRFPSAKMGRILQAESRTIELPFVLAAERDVAVLALWDQPREGWSMLLRYISRTGSPVLAHHTPDYLELRDGRWSCPPGKTYAAALGLTYRAFLSAEINWLQQRN